MKTQARLRLRQAGRHHIPHDHRGRYNGLARFGLAANLAHAFEMNCHAKHYDTGIQEPCYTMDYVTGKTTWHPLPLPPVLRPHGFEDMTFLGYIDGPIKLIGSETR